MKITKTLAGRLLISLLVLFASLFSIPNSFAQPDNIGTDFWLMFNENNSTSANQSLFISSTIATTGVVAIPGLGFNQSFSVTPGAVTTIALPSAVDMNTIDVVENKGIHVTSDTDVAVYGLNQQATTTDGFLGIPLDVLSTEYIVLGYIGLGGNGGQLGIVGTEAGTTVTITPSETVASRTANVPYNIILNEGDTYQLIANTGSRDLTGTIITSTAPIGVYGGAKCANVPITATYCDHIVEEMAPTNTWGTQFLTAPLASRTGGDIFRILASVDSTVVSLNGSTVATLNRGEFHEMDLPSSSYNEINTTGAALLAQYSKGTSADGVTSDPFMMLVPPFEQFSGAATFTTPASGFSAHFVNVVVQDGGIGTVQLDGVVIPAVDFTAIGSSGFSGAQIPISAGPHNINEPGGFLMGSFVYGFGNFDSYGYPTGQLYSPAALATTLTVDPVNGGSSFVGTAHCLTATVQDQNSMPLEGVRVDFVVTGVNPTSGFAFTNASGEAEYCYTGNNPGADGIEATISTLSASANKTWEAEPLCELIITCPAAITLNCDQNILPAGDGGDAGPAATATASQDCSGFVVGYTDVSSGCGQYSYMITRTWEATDTITSATCVQIITVQDTIPPIPGCVNISITLDTTGLYVLNQSDLDAIASGSSDNCGSVNATTATSILFDCDNVGPNTVNVILTDLCGNSSSCSATVTVLASSACCSFEATCPTATDLGDFDCTQLGNIPALPTTATQATAAPYNITIGVSPCGTIVVLAMDDITIYDVCTVGGQTVSRTVTVFDDLDGNGTLGAGEDFQDCVYIFDIVQDITPPTITCSAQTSPIDCPSTPVWVAPTVSDACDTLPTLVFNDVTTPACGNTFSVTRTWTATDACNNSSTCSATIVVQDITPPMITCPSDVTVFCADDTSSVTLGMATAIDLCSAVGDVTISSSDVVTPTMITRTWTATDECGNGTNCIQIITLVSCEFNADDPCNCLNNATVLDLDAGTGGDDGQFSELVSITGPNGGPIANSMLDFRVAAITGGTDAFNIPPVGTQSAGVAIPIGTMMQYNNVTMHYELPFVHIDDMGYNITIQQFAAGAPAGGLFTIGNHCVYPNPVFNPAIQALYCPSDVAFTLGGSDPAGPGADAVSFTIDNNIATSLDPSALAVGFHTLVMTWDGAAGTNNASGTAANPNQPGCTQMVQTMFEVNDTEPPMITCPADVSLACTDSTDPADTGMATAIDNCNTAAVIVSSDVSTQGTEGCSQYDYTILRTWTATDGIGLTVSCVQTIDVSDTTPPVITCLPGMVLTCFETLPSPVTNAADFIAAGGTISDDCTADLDEFTVFAQNDDNGGDNCPGNGQVVVRTYFIADACGNTSTCEQTFTYLESTQGPVITSILPTCFKYCASLANPMDADITYDTDCNFGATVSITGPTQIGADNCPGSIYRYTYTVTDDCGRTSLPATRDFVIGNDGPTIECAPFNLLLECGDPNNADYIAAHIATASASSSCELDVNINHFPSNFNNITCNTSTVVTFIATDACGRTASCTSTINISDNTAPVITSTYVDGVCNEAVCGSNVSFWFNSWKSKVLEGLSATDACDSNVSFSTSGSPNSATQDCPDGTAETVVTWLANDNCGNAGEISYSFFVVPADAPAPSPGIMGMVATEQTETVENVTVMLQGNALSMTDITAADGMYGFENLVEGQNYYVTPLLDENPLNGVSSFDLVLIAKHILQLEQLDSPYKMIAADINKSGSITTMDMVELRKLILHIDDNFANNTSWRFVEAAYVFPMPTNPFASIFPEEVNINGLSAEEEHDFVGVKIGDVNGSAIANQFAQAEDRAGVDELLFNVKDQQLVAEETYEVAFEATNFDAIYGYQFTLNFDQTALAFEEVSTGGLSGMNDGNFGLTMLDEGVITTSWTNQIAQSLSRDAAVFKITFVAKANVSLRDVININSHYTQAEAYNSNLDLMDVQIRFQEDDLVTKGFRLYQNTPNPFRQETVIGFDLEESTAATLNIYDGAGRLLKQVEGDFNKGYNSVSVSNDGLTSGLLYYQLVTAMGTLNKKMILQ
ncbi:MAG: hypothetical protein ACI8YQ_002950 [Polaribacter sp.]|jgi:hypothetical protein